MGALLYECLKEPQGGGSSATNFWTVTGRHLNVLSGGLNLARFSGRQQ